jgi:murein DD-endopeptidase MepM/ murein hydrolase activator NlpD
MNALGKKFVVAISVLAAIVLLVNTSYVSSWYTTLRPISTNGGRVNQLYLYGEETEIDDEPVSHKGVDFSADFGTDVYAIAHGSVVDMRESVPDDNHNHTPIDTWAWGNYVVIRHSDQTFNFKTGNTAYVYSIYAHLRRDSVTVAIGQLVSEGFNIAEVDNTGNSTGSHLHLQIVINDLSDRTISTLSTETNSRNPEVWIEPYQGNTSRAIGKVTDSNGQPLTNKIICGMQKSYGDYGFSRTYSFNWANPDDFIGENFATTDIAPGSYYLTAKNYVDTNSDCSNTQNFRNLGWYDFTAGETTYIGIDPVIIPILYSQYNGFNSSITIRNNSTTDKASVRTTILRNSGLVKYAYDHIVNPNSALEISTYYPNLFYFLLSARIYSSQDISVIVTHTSDTGESYAYNATSHRDTYNVGWGEIGKVLYTPVIMRNYYDWNTQLFLSNSTPDNGSATIYYYNASGQQVRTQDIDLPRNTSWGFDYPGLPNTLYSAKIVANVPISAVVRQYRITEDVSETYNAFSEGATDFTLPLIMVNYYYWETSVNIQNISDSPATVTLRYYDHNGSQPLPSYYTKIFTIPAHGVVSRYSPLEFPPDHSMIGSAKITSTQPVVAVVNQSYNRSGFPNRGLSYSGAIHGCRNIMIPDIVNYIGTDFWVSSVNVRNMGSTSTGVTLSIAGINQYVTINGNGFRSFYIPQVLPPYAPYHGPATVTSDSQNISVVVNQSSTYADRGDLARSYTAFCND